MRALALVFWIVGPTSLSAAQGFGVGRSTGTANMMLDLRHLSLIQPGPKGWETLGRFFDIGAPRAHGEALVRANPAFGNSRQALAAYRAQATTASTPQSFGKITYQSGGIPGKNYGVNQGALLGIRVSGDGKLYRLTGNSTQGIEALTGDGIYGRGPFGAQQSVPRRDGAVWTSDGGYQGRWRGLQNIDTRDLRALEARPVNGKEALYTARGISLWEGSNWGIYKDGSFLSAVNPFQEMQADSRGNVYIRRDTFGSSVISQALPGANKEKVLYTVPYAETRHLHYIRAVKAGGGVEYWPTEEKHKGLVSSFEVAPDGGVYWIQNGLLYKGQSDGTGKLVYGSKVSERNPVIVHRDGNITHVKSDSKGNVYAVTDLNPSVFRNGEKVIGASIGRDRPELTTAFSMEFDDNGNAFAAFQDRDTSTKLFRFPVP